MENEKVFFLFQNNNNINKMCGTKNFSCQKEHEKAQKFIRKKKLKSKKKIF